MIRKFFRCGRRYSHVVLPGSSAHAAAPEEQLIEAVKVALDKNFNTDWSGLDAQPALCADCQIKSLNV